MYVFLTESVTFCNLFILKRVSVQQVTLILLLMFPPAVSTDATVKSQVQQKEQKEGKIQDCFAENGVLMSWRLQTGALPLSRSLGNSEDKIVLNSQASDNLGFVLHYTYTYTMQYSRIEVYQYSHFWGIMAVMACPRHIHYLPWWTLKIIVGYLILLKKGLQVKSKLYKHSTI